MSVKTLNVGIIGGGIGGLALAIALRKAHVKVTLFEKSKTFVGYGAGVQLSSNGVKVLRYLGVEHLIEQKATQPQKVLLKNANSGSIISEIPLGNFTRRRYSTSFYLVHRNDLIQVLAKNAIDLGTKCFLGSRANICEGANDISSVIANKKKFDFDVIVAADGVNSATRKKLFPEMSEPKFFQQVAYRATVPFNKVDAAFTKEEINLYLGSGCHLVSYPLVSKSLVNLVFCKDQKRWDDNQWSLPAEKSEIIKEFSRFSGIESLLLNVHDIHKWGLFGYESSESWFCGNVALLGDACHPMLPYLAQGANQALEDSRSLAHFLTQDNRSNKQEVLKIYQNNRKNRVSRIQKHAIRNARVYHLPEGPLRTLLHTGMSLVTKLMPNFLITRFDWIYKYELKIKS